MGCQIKLWSIHGNKGVPESLGSDVPNLMKDVQRVRKMRHEVGIDPQSLCYGFLKEIMDHPC